MTPVDIDKLKELQSLLLDGEWWQTVTRGPNPTSFTSDMTHVARQAAALIAKAERVDAMEALLRPFAEAAVDLDDRHGDYSPIWEAPAAMNITAGDLRAARNTLSPKESE